MTIQFRTTDGDKWGAGKGSNLTPGEVDLNFWELLARLTELESEMPDASVGIDHFTVSGATFSVVMSDATTRGPYALPVAKFTIFGEWAPGIDLPAQVFVTHDGDTYLVNVAHHTAGAFDAGATDGMGHTLLGLLPFAKDRTYDVGFFFPGQIGRGFPLDGPGTVFSRVFSRQVYLPSGLTDSVARLGTATTDEVTLLIFKDATQIGTIHFNAASTTGTFSFVSNVQFSAGDRLRVTMWDGEPPTDFALDGTATDLALNFAGIKGTP